MTQKKRLASISAILLPPLIILVAFFILPTITEVAMNNSMPLELPPPDALPSLRTAPLFFCQNIDCLTASDGPDSPQSCPQCGFTTDRIPLSERRLLPPDADLFHQRYIDDNGNVVSLAAVVSGQARSSLHKPEFCLPSQGLSILSDMQHTVVLGTDQSIDVRMLDVAPPNASRASQRGLFVYWYSSPTMQTGSQFSKNLAMITHRLFRGRLERWAYVSLLISYSGDRESTVTTIDSFIGELYPLLEKPQVSRGENTGK